VLTLAFVILPLAGTAVDRTSILTPLGTELVPLGVRLQSLPTPVLHFEPVAASAKRILGLLPSAFAFHPERNARPHEIGLAGYSETDTIRTPHGRSPPSD
jgi:hypothetical protein